jgi:DNA repair exonuclease SbcCD nuclease subunit
MKFVHIADVHFDRPFIHLSDRGTLGDSRRLDQRKAFKQVTEYIQNNQIPYLFISGDLYEHTYVKRSTIEYINQLFKEIPETQIFISPGNHDPYIKNSYYTTYSWNENVTIFSTPIQKIELPELNLYGYGFTDFYCQDSGLTNFTIDEPEKINILIIHGTLNGANLEDKQYNSFTQKAIQEKGFDYVALGHIHEPMIKQDPPLVYPGALISLGFDELGEHGMVVGDIQKGQLKLTFMPLDEKEFILYPLEVTDCYSMEDLIEHMNELIFTPNELVKIELIGKRNFEIDPYYLMKMITNPQIIKIKNHTQINYSLEKLANEATLKGLFATEMLAKLNEKELTEEERETIERAIEIGMEALS